MNYNKNINEQKSKNVFKIAFGTKMLTNEHRKKTLKVKILKIKTLKQFIN